MNYKIILLEMDELSLYDIFSLSCEDLINILNLNTNINLSVNRARMIYINRSITHVLDNKLDTDSSEVILYGQFWNQFMKNGDELMKSKYYNESMSMLDVMLIETNSEASILRLKYFLKIL